MMTQGELRMLRLCSGLLTRSSGKCGCCSRPETKTEPAKMRLESNFRGKHSSKVILAGDLAARIIVMNVLSRFLHPHPDIKRVELSALSKGAVVLSPWLDFDLTCPSAVENELQDPVAPPVLREWSQAYLRGAPLDNYNQSGRAPGEWWRGLPVEHFLVTAGEKGAFVKAIAKFGEKVKVK
jgi:hypothetical protein